MYSVYDTDAFILESSGKREADKIFSLYTEDFGRILATAQGVRLTKSKLRGHLLDYSLAHVSLVRGKENWRIVSAERILPLPDESHPECQSFVRALRLLKRLVKGEEANTELFTLLRNAYNHISSQKSADAKSFEALLIIRILERLGYIASPADISQYVSAEDFSPDIISQFSVHIRKAIGLINSAIEESQL